MKTMGKRWLFILLIVVLAVSGQSAAYAQQLPANPDTSGWLPWVWPDDEAALGSAIDVSFLLDAPAGKHGFVHAEGENFVFENGVRARFWGVNIAMSANFLEAGEAEKLADRIVRSGFNIVRFHQMDYGPQSNIFASIPAELTQTRQLDDQQLDKLFYFMSLLKERGVYFYVDLLTMRPALAADGIEHPEDLSQGWKAHALFDPMLITLQKEYAKHLLTTVNPYTQLTLADDPALAFIDIHNENSLFVINADRIREPHYINQLKARFSQFLQAKYGTDAALQAAWAENNMVGLRAGESMLNNTVDIIGDGTVRIPDLYTNLNYSTPRKNDSYAFFYDLVREHYIDMRDYLRDELQVKAMITGSSIGGHPSTRPASMYLNKELMDYTDRHVYKSHPSRYFTPNSVADNSSLLRDGNNFFREAAYKRVYNQPYILGEWQQSTINDFRAEGNLMMAAMASFQNWSAIQFQMLAEPIPIHTPQIRSAFGTYNDPAHTIIQPAAAILFHRGDVKEAEDAYYVPYTQADVLNPSKGFPSTFEYNIYRYGKVGITFSDFADYNPALSSQAAFNQLTAKRVSEETRLSDELTWEPDAFLVDTPYTNAVAGLQPGQAKEFGDSILQYTNPFAVISLNSITGETLQHTDRMLLTAVARARNTGFTLSGCTAALNSCRITSTGSAPVLYEPVNGTITLKTGDDIAVYALDESGQRAASVSVAKTAEGYSRFQLQGQQGRYYYEIVRSGTALPRNEALFKDSFDDYADHTTAAQLVSSGAWDGHVSAGDGDSAYSKVLGGQFVMQGRTTAEGALSAPELRKQVPRDVTAGGHVLELTASIRTGTVGSTSISLYDNAGGGYVATNMVTLQNGVARAGPAGSATVAYTPGTGTAADGTGEYVDVSILIDLRSKRYSTYVKGQPVIEDAAIGNWHASNNLAIRLVGSYSRSTGANNWGALDQIRIGPAYFKDSFDYNDNTTAAALVGAGNWDGHISANSDGAYSKAVGGTWVMHGRTSANGALSAPELRKNLPKAFAAGGRRVTVTASIRTGTVGTTAISLYDNAGASYIAANMVTLQNGTARSGAAGSQTAPYAAGTGAVAAGTGEYVRVSITLDLQNGRYSAYAGGRTLVADAPIAGWNGANDLAVRIVGSYSRSTGGNNWAQIDDFAINPAYD